MEVYFIVKGAKILKKNRIYLLICVKMKIKSPFYLGVKFKSNQSQALAYKIYKRYNNLNLL